MLDKKLNTFITYKHLERLLTSQEYFVWKSKIDNAIDELEINDEESETSLWELFSDFDLEELNDYKFIEIIKTGYDQVNDFFNNFIKEKAKKENKKFVFINEKSNQLSYEKTKAAIKDKNVDWIINPVIIYEDMISRATIYKKESKELYSLINSSKTKLKNYIKAYFDFNVYQREGINVEEYCFFTYDKDYLYLEAPDLHFVSSNYCWTQKNGPESENNIFSKLKEHVNGISIIEKLKSGHIKLKKVNKKKNYLIKDEYEILLSLYIEDFDKYIKRIRDARYINRFEQINEDDDTDWGVNPHFDELFPYDKIGVDHLSGSILTKKNLLAILKDQDELNQLKKEKTSLKFILDKMDTYDFEIIQEYVNKIENAKCVWYDFEGFSMPFVIMPYTKPYQQLVFQVSVIRTDQEQMSEKPIEIVCDPKTISLNDFKNIIDSIYWDQARHYVVYNQSYEINKMKDMIKLLEINNDQETEIYRKKVERIEELTIDLLDLFKIDNSKTKIPPIFLHKLLGFSSIKKIEKFITDSKLELEVMIEPYKNLDVKNGLMAMNKAIQRYIGTIGENEWNQTKTQLARYCTNDVKAMIMVYYFVKRILEINKKT